MHSFVAIHSAVLQIFYSKPQSHCGNSQLIATVIRILLSGIQEYLYRILCQRFSTGNKPGLLVALQEISGDPQIVIMFQSGPKQWMDQPTVLLQAWLKITVNSKVRQWDLWIIQSKNTLLLNFIWFFKGVSTTNKIPFTPSVLGWQQTSESVDE